MKSKVLLLVFSIGAVYSATIPVQTPNGTGSAEVKADQCPKHLRDAGATELFAASVAHAIHSITVDDLKKFDPSATEDNYVPTINLDLNSPQAILPYAPDMKTKDTDRFLSEGMKVFDLVMSHMDEPRWDLYKYSTLERLGHQFHMRELWAHVKVEFDKFGKDKPVPTADVCECVMDVESNGVMKELRLRAMADREPSLVYGDPSFTHREHAGDGKNPTRYDLKETDHSSVRYNLKETDPKSVRYDLKESNGAVRYDLKENGGAVRYDLKETDAKQVRYDLKEADAKSVRYDLKETVARPVRYDLKEKTDPNPVRYDLKENVARPVRYDLKETGANAVRYDLKETVAGPIRYDLKESDPKSVRYDLKETGGNAVRYDLKETGASPVRYDLKEKDAIRYDLKENMPRPVRYDLKETEAKPVRYDLKENDGSHVRYDLKENSDHPVRYDLKENDGSHVRYDLKETDGHPVRYDLKESGHEAVRYDLKEADSKHARYDLKETDHASKNPEESLMSEDSKGIVPALTNSANWEIWKSWKSGHHGDPALFLYCALAKARNERKV